MTYNFAKRLEEALKMRNKKPVDLSNGTGLSQGIISQYLSSKSVAKNDKISIIAKYLNVSESWLAGFTDDIGYYEIESNSRNYLGVHEDNIAYLSRDPELLEMYNQIHQNENLQILFDTAKDLTPQDLEKVLRYMKLVIDEEL